MKTDNELIAEFMGMVKNNGNQWAYKNEIDIIENESYAPRWWHTADLQYDSSWDWLMPVVAKIAATLNELCVRTECPEVDICHWYITTVADNIELAYNSVIDFIKWYNTISHS